MTPPSGVGPTTERRGRARAVRSMSALRRRASALPRAARRDRCGEVTRREAGGCRAAGRTRDRGRPDRRAVKDFGRAPPRRRSLPSHPRRSGSRRVRDVSVPPRPRRSEFRRSRGLGSASRSTRDRQIEGAAFRRRRLDAASGRFAVRGVRVSPLARQPNWSFAHDVRRWRPSRLRSARRPNPRPSGAGRRVGDGDVAFGRSTRPSPSLRADVLGAARGFRFTLSSTPDRRRASRRRIERIRSGSGARHHPAGPHAVRRVRRRARPAQKSSPWQTRC